LDEDNLPPTSITVDFSQSNTATDFAIIIKNLQWDTSQKSNMEEFFGTYGWAITELDATQWDIDLALAWEMRSSTSGKGTRLRSLRWSIQPPSSDFTNWSVGGAQELEYMEKVIGDAQDLEQLWIQYTPSENEICSDFMKGFFSRQGSKVTGLSMKRRDDWYLPDDCYLTDDNEDVLPLRTSLPRLTDLQIWAEISSTQWLADMLSGPNSQPSTAWWATDTGKPNGQALLPLRKLCLTWNSYTAEGWTRVIEAMDFSTLEECEVSESNFSVDQFELLVWCMGRTGTPIPLQLLNVSGTKLHKGEDGERLQWTLDAFSKKAPRAIIMGIEDAPSM
jgi:hypothetical protein